MVNPWIVCRMGAVSRSRALLRCTIAALGLALAGCGESENQGVVRREGQPDFVARYDRARMDLAIAEAKSTLDEFVQALDAQRSGTSSFTLKKGFPTSDGSMEFIWISDVRRQGDRFEGTIDNKPLDVAALQVGQTVTVTRDEAIDWMYHVHGELRGGYTIAALIFGTPEQKAYEEKLGIKDWSRYRFLKKR